MLEYGSRRIGQGKYLFRPVQRAQGAAVQITVHAVTGILAFQQPRRNTRYGTCKSRNGNGGHGQYASPGL